MPEPVTSPEQPHTMQCTEVWGGNDPVDRGVVMQGLDAWVYSRPSGASDAGGDVHYLSSCSTGRIARLLLADVSGHGAAVSRVAVNLRGLMRRYLNYVDQTRLAAGINREFAALSSGGDFATAIVATYWSPTDELEITNAGHPKPLLYRARSKVWQFLDEQAADATESQAPSNIPLGVIDAATFSRVRLSLRTGDLLLCYTDAAIEARNADGRLLGADGLMTAVRSLNAADPPSLIAGLTAHLRTYAGRDELDDDLTLLIMRPNALKPRISVLAGVRISLRLIKDLVRSWLPGGERFPWPELRLDNFAGAFFRAFNLRR